MLGQNQSITISTTLSPQQIQLMKLLQLPSTALEQRIQEEIEANPVLETGDDFEDLYGSDEPVSDSETEKDDISDETAEDFREEEELPLREEDYELDEYLERFAEDDPSEYRMKGESRNADEEEKTIPIALENSFHEFLEQQLGLLDLKTEREIQIAKQIIGSIDEDGYLRRNPINICDDVMFLQHIETDEQEVVSILEKIQRFDPPGVGARTLQECLLIQIRQKLELNKTDAETVKKLRLAARLIFDLFDEFTKKHYQKMQKSLGLSEEELKDVLDEILKLNPKPSSGYVSDQERNMQYIVPDFTIETKEGNRLELSVDSRNVPDLRISEHYREMLKSYKSHRNKNTSARMQKEAVMFIKQKIDSAKWFIDAIRQREQTMFKTMYAIMTYQQEFFMTGDAKRLKPMILKDIADVTGLDISTVSRVANSKYVQTEFGTKRLKDFFSESLQTSEGDEVSTLEVKKILTDIIKVESHRKPFSDEKLKSMLQDKGYNIARRTVAKYREQLNIPVARLRKSL
ncbi:MAG: RNA polymerase factor sigma-54 [Saprospiraceae bacterium]|nr:RNA polymerase factor sigma-54 [Saprospiraceae bacterium]